MTPSSKLAPPPCGVCTQDDVLRKAAVAAEAQGKDITGNLLRELAAAIMKAHPRCANPGCGGLLGGNHYYAAGQDGVCARCWGERAKQHDRS